MGNFCHLDKWVATLSPNPKGDALLIYVNAHFDCAGPHKTVIPLLVPSLAILQEFHAAHCKAPVIFEGLDQGLVRILVRRYVVKIFMKSCHRSLHDLVPTGPYKKISSSSEEQSQTPVRSSLRGHCLQILNMACLRRACMKALLGCFWEAVVSRSSKSLQGPLQQQVLFDDLVGFLQGSRH